MSKLDGVGVGLLIAIGFSIFLIGKGCAEFEIMKEFQHYPVEDVLKTHGWGKP